MVQVQFNLQIDIYKIYEIACFAILTITLLVITFLFFKMKKYKYNSIYALITYLVIYLWLDIYCGPQLHDYQYDLVPLQLLKTVFYGEGVYFSNEIIFNILFFIPIGLILSFVFHYEYPSKRRYKKTFLYGSTLIICIEILQLVSKTGAFRTDDIILKLLGCAIGAFAHAKLFWSMGLTKQTIRIEKKKAFKSRTLRRLAFEEAKKECSIWIIFAIAIILPFVSYKWIGIHNDYLHKIRVVFDNLSYSYIAGMIFYFFTSFSNRVRKKFKAKLQLQQSFSKIYNYLLSILSFFKCIDKNGNLLPDADEIIINSLRINAEKKHLCLLQRLKARIENYFLGSKKTWNVSNMVTLNPVIMRNIKAWLSLISKEVDHVRIHNYDSLNEYEMKALNNFKSIQDKLHYSSLTEFIHSSKLEVDTNDFNYFVSSVTSSYNEAKRLSQEYKKYSFYAMNPDNN